jgi:hypothetical protein
MVKIKIIYTLLVIYLFFISNIQCQDNIEDLKEHVDSVCSEPEHKHFSGTTLSYITPWNLNGLELTLKYSAKFDIVSPCWFDIKPENLQGKFNSKVKFLNKID